jgi:hypothetical protein
MKITNRNDAANDRYLEPADAMALSGNATASVDTYGWYSDSSGRPSKSKVFIGILLTCLF